MTKKEEKTVNKLTDKQLSNVNTKQAQINDALHRIGVLEVQKEGVKRVFEGFSKEMVACSTDFEPQINEFEISGLTPSPCQKIKPPFVKEALVSYECELNQIIPVGDESPGGGFIVIGTIVLFHISDNVYEDGKINLEELCPVGRLAGNNYVRTTDTFEIVRKIKPK